MRYIQLLSAGLAVLLLVTPARSALTVSSEIQGDFEFSFLSSGPLSAYATSLNIPTDTFLPYRALGMLTFELDDSNPTATSMPFTNVTGQLNGVSPFTDFFITPNVEFIGGELTNIMRDAGGQVTSATVSDLTMRWSLTAFPGNATLERRVLSVPLSFSGNVTGLPFLEGNILNGPTNTPENGFWDGDLNTPAALVQNRTLTAVPEPSSVICLLVGGCWVMQRRRRNAPT